MNWNGEATKDKAFSLRNFETDKKVYIHIKTVLPTSRNNEEKIVQVIKKINMFKSLPNNQTQENSSKSQTTTGKAINRAAPDRSTIQNTAKMPVMVSAQAVTPVTVPVSVTSIVGVRTPVTISTAVLAATTPSPLNLTKHMSQPNHINTPVAIQPKPNTMNPLTASLPVNPTVNEVAVNPVSTAIRPGREIVAQLLIPNRPQMRNRAMSVHISANEYTAARLLMRRQSVNDNGAHMLGNSSMGISGTALDHSYSYNMNPNGQQFRRILPKSSYPQPPPTFMTKIHSKDLMGSLPPQNIIPRSNQLKVLTPDDLNSSTYSV